MTRILAAVAGTLLLAAPGFAQTADTPGSANDPLLLNFPKAQAEVPAGQLLQARTETKSGGVKVYGYYFLLQGRVWEVEVFQTGKIVKKEKGPAEPEDPEHPPIAPDLVKALSAQKASKAKLPDGRLMELAAGAAPNKDFKEMKYEVRDGKLVVLVGKLVIDAETGKVISGGS